MKRIAAVCLFLALCLCAAGALAQTGFAEVAKDSVNLRKSPGGEVITRLPAGRSVYVMDEQERGDQLWCRVYTYIGKNPRSGYIRADMLRMLGDEFHDVVSVEAGDMYVLGLRADGTVCFAGADERHAAQVRALRDVVDIAAGSRFAIALLEDGSVVMTGEYTEEYFR